MGPSYVLNGIAYKFVNGRPGLTGTGSIHIENTGQFPSHVYSTSGHGVSLGYSSLQMQLIEADDIGYTVIIEGICAKLQEQSSITFGVLRFGWDEMQTMCYAEHDTFEILLKISTSGNYIKIPQTNYWTSLGMTEITMLSASFLIRARRGVLFPIVHALPSKSKTWLEFQHALEPATVRGIKAISIQFNRQYHDDADELDAHDVIAVDGVELMINLIDPNFKTIHATNLDTLHTSAPGSTSESACYCKVGYWGDYDSKCTECAKGTFVTLKATQECSDAKYMYVPTHDQLSALDLSASIGGDAVNGWLRLYVMVGVHIHTDSTSYPTMDCEYRLRI